MDLSGIHACENADPFCVLLGFVFGVRVSDATSVLCSSGAGIQLCSPKMAKLEPAYLVCLPVQYLICRRANAALLQSVYLCCTVQFASNFVCCCRVRAFVLEDRLGAGSGFDVGGLWPIGYEQARHRLLFRRRFLLST